MELAGTFEFLAGIFIFIEILKIEPLLKPSDTTEMWPLFISTIFLQISKPMPMPSGLSSLPENPGASKLVLFSREPPNKYYNLA